MSYKQKIIGATLFCTPSS